MGRNKECCCTASIMLTWEGNRIMLDSLHHPCSPIRRFWTEKTWLRYLLLRYYLVQTRDHLLICYNTYPRYWTGKRATKQADTGEKTRPRYCTSMQRKRTNPACRQRVQCILSLGVYQLPASNSVSYSVPSAAKASGNRPS